MAFAPSLAVFTMACRAEAPIWTSRPPEIFYVARCPKPAISPALGVMSSLPRQQDTSESYAPSGDAARALAGLTQADLRRAELIAQARANGLRAMDWQDLLQEAVSRILQGARRWPAEVPMIAFLAQTMRSIASEARHRESREVDETHSLEGRVDPTIERQLDEAARLARIEAHFARDAAVLSLLEGLRAGETAQETQRRADMTPQTYDAARKRFWRNAAKIIGEWA